jgi:hypothetical protein
MDLFLLVVGFTELRVSYFQVLYSYSIYLVSRVDYCFLALIKKPSPPKIILQQLGQSSTTEDPPVFAPPQRRVCFFCNAAFAAYKIIPHKNPSCQYINEIVKIIFLRINP